MKFTEFESIMNSLGVYTLADISRKLDTTPQAVSNWKARDQVPYHIVSKINQPLNKEIGLSETEKKYAYYDTSNKDSIIISDILLILAEQIKVILIVPLIAMFITFTYIKLVKEPVYESSSTILLPENKSNMGAFSGIASQFGIGAQQSSQGADLSSPSLFPELVNSRVFANRIMKTNFYTDKYNRAMPFIDIITSNEKKSEADEAIIKQKAISIFQDMVNFESEGTLSVLTVKAAEPEFAKELNLAVLNELQKLNRLFKRQSVSEKITFINNRIKTVDTDLKKSEQGLKLFRERNRQLTSPALLLQEERLIREVEIQKGIYLTLKQQLELSKIEEVQKGSVIQVLDSPEAPLDPSNKNLKTSLFLSSFLGVVIGIMFGFIRKYFNNNDMDERRKLRRVKTFMKKKGKDFVLDRRIAGILSVMLIVGLPFYIGYESKYPVYFGRYSTNLMIFNTAYVLFLILFVSLFIYLSRLNYLDKNK
tara:strand:- start:63502 stop:64941 length:1440 start_codon:yes stop_codon:yes gene_type:complete